jgi:hypothetical protein
MVDGSSALLAHTTPIGHYDVALSKVIQSQNPPEHCCPNNESQPRRGLVSPNDLPRERKAHGG